MAGPLLFYFCMFPNHTYPFNIIYCLSKVITMGWGSEGCVLKYTKIAKIPHSLQQKLQTLCRFKKNYSYTNYFYLNKVNKANTFICLKMHSPENSYWSNFKRKTGKKVSCDMFKKFTTSWQKQNIDHEVSFMIYIAASFILQCVP